jgi:hypothetical protein
MTFFRPASGATRQYMFVCNRGDSAKQLCLCLGQKEHVAMLALVYCSTQQSDTCVQSRHLRGDQINLLAGLDGSCAIVGSDGDELLGRCCACMCCSAQGSIVPDGSTTMLI